MAAPVTMSVPTTMMSMPAMTVSTAMAVPSTMARGKLVSRMDRTGGLHLDLRSHTILGSLSRRHRRSERKRRREYDSNRFHFLLLLIAGIRPATMR